MKQNKIVSFVIENPIKKNEEKIHSLKASRNNNRHNSFIGTLSIVQALFLQSNAGVVSSLCH